MRLGDRESRNIEDRRGMGRMGGRGGGIAVGGLGGVAIVLICLFLGVDPSMILGDGSGEAPQTQQSQQTRQAGTPGGEDSGRRFVAQVLGDTEQVWNAEFQKLGRQYQEPALVLYTGATSSGCGAAQSQVGPFYCPSDQRVYIDLDFMAQLQQRLGATGDFAAAYIIAHEVGHHVQNQLGILDLTRRLQQQAQDQAQANGIQVRVELQADCLAGLWARQAQEARSILERGDIEEGLNAAAAVGDDRLQRRSQGQVQPESFTHGSSAERMRWFRTGLERGELAACDTFAGLR
ncbi:KPN_02809 family neutral zinc metallopeptidase [Teichococcus vastitatis]|jgi:predicted metalloprotease|uniref:Zinc metallopeptidase n=1 Tax=Teichococcus vastitatis TaxID=2307076 RepID=A0ABS9W9J0_9PROT|nr:neutral zinc metallopeptidase [Pseudoroseomonas vastitatis]MCI0755967.1 zinc metallopeptidase [Pseudoroseomonas vastitatis]